MLLNVVIKMHSIIPYSGQKSKKKAKPGNCQQMIQNKFSEGINTGSVLQRFPIHFFGIQFFLFLIGKFDQQPVTVTVLLLNWVSVQESCQLCKIHLIQSQGGLKIQGSPRNGRMGGYEDKSNGTDWWMKQSLKQIICKHISTSCWKLLRSVHHRSSKPCKGLNTPKLTCKSEDRLQAPNITKKYKTIKNSWH